MKYLVAIFFLFLNCSVHSRVISKRSLHHPEPSDVYLPPPEETVVESEEVTNSLIEPRVKPAETYLVDEEVTTLAAAVEVTVTEPAVVETEAPAVKPEETYLVFDEISTEVPEAELAVTDVVDVKSGDDEAVETEAPVIKPAETYLVAEEITGEQEEENNEEDVAVVKSVLQQEATSQESEEVPEAELAVTDVVDVKSGDDEAVETEAPVIKPAETFLVAEEITGEQEEEYNEEDVAVVKSVLQQEATSQESEEVSVEEITTVLAIVDAIKEAIAKEVPAIETISTSVDPKTVEAVEEEVIIQTKPVSGYWIEVSGDRDVLVKYYD